MSLPAQTIKLYHLFEVHNRPHLLINLKKMCAISPRHYFTTSATILQLGIDASRKKIMSASDNDAGDADEHTDNNKNKIFVGLFF